MDSLLGNPSGKLNLDSTSGVAAIQPFNQSAAIDPVLIFDGAENDDNYIETGTYVAPPDTVGDSSTFPTSAIRITPSTDS